MSKKCPFKPLVSVETRKLSSSKEERTQNTKSFTTCDEDDYMVWNASNSTCKRLDQVVLHIADKSNQTESQSLEGVSPSKTESVPPCGDNSCEDCIDYGNSGSFPCPDYVFKNGVPIVHY